MSIGNFKVKHYIKKHDVGDITKKYFKLKTSTQKLVWHPHETSCGQGKTMPKQGLIPQATVKGHRTPCGIAKKACYIHHS
ncbi:hypothetical protein GmHk_18G053523 [Glycine max]|nr:hypothetical protein GmHk_18G053523 [Glycine max]